MYVNVCACVYVCMFEVWLYSLVNGSEQQIVNNYPVTSFHEFTAEFTEQTKRRRLAQLYRVQMSDPAAEGSATAGRISGKVISMLTRKRPAEITKDGQRATARSLTWLVGWLVYCLFDVLRHFDEMKRYLNFYYSNDRHSHCLPRRSSVQRHQYPSSFNHFMERTVINQAR